MIGYLLNTFLLYWHNWQAEVKVVLAQIDETFRFWCSIINIERLCVWESPV